MLGVRDRQLQRPRFREAIHQVFGFSWDGFRMSQGERKTVRRGNALSEGCNSPERDASGIDGRFHTLHLGVIKVGFDQLHDRFQSCCRIGALGGDR
jgi:hypothetical protein